jgi:hypothetical protein
MWDIVVDFNAKKFLSAFVETGKLALKKLKARYKVTHTTDVL